ncbi:MAG TPA: class I SAM-dependent methyltransferase [Pseudonocardiaceae bacterium]
MDDDWEVKADQLAGAAVEDGQPTRWFDELYSAGERGEVSMPWDRGNPNGLIAEWVGRREGAGARALVIGCGLGRDSEHLASLGYAVTAIDVAPTAIKTAQERFPDSTAHYRVADLLDAPADLLAAFDLVVESYTVQALPPSVRADATKAVTAMVAPGGTLLVIATALPEGEPVAGPPWKMSRADIDAFAAHGLDPVLVEEIDSDSGYRHWRAEFHRPAH